MNKVIVFLLKCMQQGGRIIFGDSRCDTIPTCDVKTGNSLIYDMLVSNTPCMIARFGATEMACILNYISVIKNDRNILKYIKGETSDWWWNSQLIWQMENCGGFFPPSENNLCRFSELMLKDCKALDILGSFKSVEKGIASIKSYLPHQMKIVPLVSFDSFTSPNPWTSCLKDKRVLVIHPFSELIESQYKKREYLFDNKNVLPKFDLRTVKAVQSLGGVDNGFKDWFEALEWMQSEMDKVLYDIALIGCGAYGFPLAAYAKRTGHKAVHIGGSLQLLFGIKGKRWENVSFRTDIGIAAGFYKKLLDNPSWVRPEGYKDKHSDKVEDACYW